MSFFSSFGGFPFGGSFGGGHDEDDCTSLSTQPMPAKSITPNTTKF
jgi:hypothetical protein